MELVVETYEARGKVAGNDLMFLVMKHTFKGNARKECAHFSRSHAKTDSFYRLSGGPAAVKDLLRHQRDNRGSSRGKFQGIRTLCIAWFQ